MDYVTSDHHFGHRKIIEMANRPFADLAAMTTELIKRHNSRVTDRDTVYILGDIAFRLPPRYLAQLLHEMRGRKKLLFGNHDRKLIKKAERKGLLEELCHRGRVSILGDYHEIVTRWKGAKTRVCLFHNPILHWTAKANGSFHLHGHSHGHVPASRRRCDVGVDVWDYYPVALPDILAYCEDLPPAADLSSIPLDSEDEKQSEEDAATQLPPVLLPFSAAVVTPPTPTVEQV